MLIYNLLKVIHIGSLVLWLGPALGAWLVLRVAQRQLGEEAEATRLIYSVFLLSVTLEHIALIALLASGVGMAVMAGWFGSGWLSVKLAIVGAVILPLEVVDIWLGNWQIYRIIGRQNRGLAITAGEAKWLAIYHGPFTKIALLLLPATVLVIMWLAVSKSTFG
ncbi:DUF2269 family protein [Halioxenophilus sp. WMMB6]|uniref:DUF2269 family protein n=1 Tax=Halioxenophilus sp. WMMB6 TaxID=3073815 RepID=UPI00295F3442|nr:DUF2269 family protein [Halioxenophilus sp. WMMB6]